MLPEGIEGFPRFTCWHHGYGSVWIGAMITAHVAGEAFGELGRAGLITIVVIAPIATPPFVWIFHQLGRREWVT